MGRAKETIKRNFRNMSTINRQGRQQIGNSVRAFKEGRKQGDTIPEAVSKAAAVDAARRGDKAEFDKRQKEIKKDRDKKKKKPMDVFEKK